ncbi:MAG: excinuclease ABC subunit UvrA [Phycisphaerae bacterium]|nr:excinuclease ABC subunit UvrA [Phycisphaerae bacterium]
MEPKIIRVTGARQHNLQNVDVDIPRDRLVVITGLSGSGKSSLAFDTIYAEGQRKYVESLSVHARHYLEQIGKPDVESIEGLPPTLAIEQRAAATNPRSTVATTTEIYDFLRVLFARVGVPHCPKCGQRIYRRTVDQIVDVVLSYPPLTRVMVMSPLARGRTRELQPVLRRIQREGFVRARINGRLSDVKDISELPKSRPLDIDVVVDRLILRPEIRSRLADAVELSLSLGEGTVIISRADGVGAGDSGFRVQGSDTSAGTGTASADEVRWVDEVFSERHTCTTCGVSLPELSPRAFSFNSPYGACEHCGGLGTTLRFDPQLIVPDEDVTLNGGAIAPWASGKKRLAATHLKLLRTLCGALDVKMDTPFGKLPEDLRRVILHGTTKQDSKRYGVSFEGIIPNLERRYRAAGSDGSRSRLSNFQTEHVCEHCRGARLLPTSLAVHIGGRNIHEFTQLSISDANVLFQELCFEGEAIQISEPIMREIRQRLRFMDNVGLGYLTLDRTSGTLSGGEAQRIRLATQLGSGLVGVCYVLDEPTIGLHQRDNERLLNSIRNLVDIGNTVIVVEHDEDVIRAADHLIDMGPGAGLHGGKIIAEGPADKALKDPASITGKYLRGEYGIPLPDQRRTPRRSDFIQVLGARQNNLKNIDVHVPLGVLCAVTGVSGSGKSTLVSQILLPALRRRLYKSKEQPGEHERVVGANKVDKVIEIDQTAIGRTPRSNPATYTGVFDEIRRLYAKTKEARIRGYTASRFSFNAKGGRCEACQGQGTRRIEMHFLPDVFVECQECKGTRYSRETLEIRYRGKSIANILEMRVEEALRFFESFQKITQGLRALSDVGLGYVRLGQPSNTLSGGEAQRVKLAAELAKGVLYPIAPNGPPSASATQRAKLENHTLYVLDEPTTGLHFADIQTLLAVLNRLVDMGNTVLVIEHNLDVVKNADWIIDLGPEGGDAGGLIAAAGPPEEVAADKQSHTGRYLRNKLDVAK